MPAGNRVVTESSLSLLERAFYFIVTASSVVYICYCVYRDSILYDGLLNLYDFGPGWKWLGKDQDLANFEWNYWFAKFWVISPWYLGHIALGRLTISNTIQTRKYIFTIFSVVALCSVVGWLSVCIYLIHTVMLYISALTGFTMMVWLTSLLLLSTLNYTPTVTVMKSLVDDDTEETAYYLLMFTLALSNIRATSFCVEKCWEYKRVLQEVGPQQPDKMYNQVVLESTKKQETSRKAKTAEVSLPVDIRGGIEYCFTDILFYVLYLPLFFTGPILTYDLFKAQINIPITERSKTRLTSLSLRLLRFIFWAFFNEFILHFFYFNAIQNSLEVLKLLPKFTLAGLGYCHGQFFMMKYVVMYGYPGTIARFDGLEPPDPPKCITYIYLYSDMWKFFDRGLYNFLKRYIYIPCGGSKEGTHRQIIGSLLCFMYIFYWHGAEVFILVFILLNYVGVSLERLGALICSISFVKHLETNVLSPAMVQRIHGLFAIPIFLISCFSVFCFFGGKEVGYLFFERLILDGWYGSYMTIVCLLYCAIQNAIEVRRWQDKRDLQQQKQHQN